MNPPIAARVGGVANRCAAPPSIARTDAIARASTRPRRSSASLRSARAIVRRRRRRTRATIRRHRRGRYFQRDECRDAPETASGRRSGCSRGGDDAYSTHFSTHDAIAWATRTRARSTDGSALKKRSCGFRVLSPTRARAMMGSRTRRTRVIGAGWSKSASTATRARARGRREGERGGRRRRRHTTTSHGVLARFEHLRLQGRVPGGGASRARRRADGRGRRRRRGGGVAMGD